MATFDLIILSIILLSAIVGLVQGFLKEICSLVTWVLAIWMAWRFAPVVTPWLGETMRNAPYGIWAGRAVVFFAVLVAGAIIGYLLNHFVRMSLFSGMDRLLGFLLGVIRGVVIVSLIIILAQSARLDEEGWWKQSRFVPVLTPAASLLRVIVGEYLPERRAGQAG